MDLNKRGWRWRPPKISSLRALIERGLRAELVRGATELWTHDGGFVKIPGLLIRDPLKA
ncbi:MAG: hypothetical protein ACKOEX_06470 [Planctomycetia bacterium]